MRERPTVVIVGVLVLALTLLAWAALPRTAAVNWTDTYQVIDGFGGSCADFYEPLSDKMADFFFTTCPGICPHLSNSLEQVQSAFVRDNNFKIVSFSVDPAKDSIMALRKYADETEGIHSLER